MARRWHACLVPVSLTLLFAGDQPWKDKQIAQWTEDDAKQVLSDSPWVKTVTPEFNRSAGGQRGSRGGMGGGGMGGPRIGGGIGGIGLPGGGIGGMGGPRIGGGRRSGPMGTPGDSTGDQRPARTPPTLTLRWESALPVREAELKTRDTGAPAIDEGYYAIVVLGVPSRLAGSAKPKGELKREGRKTIKASGVKVVARDEGPLLIFLFPRSKEITAKDKSVEFGASVGPLQFKQSFYLDDMVCNGKLEL